MNIDSSSDIHQKALICAKKNEEFKLVKINNTFKLISTYFGNSISAKSKKINPIELGFIKRVKNHVIKNEVYSNFIDNFYYPSDIRYVNVRKQKKNTVINDVVEIDIDEAYFRTAFLLGVIDLKLYNEGCKENNKISKIGRLISLGSLAKKETTYSFRGRKLIKSEEKRSLLTENIWYSICKRVSDLMWEAKTIAGSDFISYWVDGIYIQNNPDKVEKIVEMFKSFNYEVKIKNGLTVEYTSDRIIITDSNIEKSKKGHVRPFFISKNKIKPSYFTDSQLKETAIMYSKYGVLDDEIDSEKLNS